YLQARALEIQGGLPRYVRGVGSLEQAIAKGPSFAPAYSGLAVAYAYRLNSTTADELAKVRAVAEKAIQLDPLLAEGHEALGAAYARDAQWGQAEKSFRLAIEIDPSSSRSHSDFVMFLLFPLGRIEEAVRQMRLVEKMDPLSPRGSVRPRPSAHSGRPIR